MTRPVRIIRKIIVLIISLPLFVLGIILIPLPGPGLLVSLLALVVLSLEFEKAKIYRDKIIAKLKGIMAASRDKNSNK